jgi:hypothetical protein
VLLGDVIELRNRPIHAALTAAQPVLAELAAALPPAAEVVIVPGNHDHHLLSGWLARRALDGVPPGLGLESAVDGMDVAGDCLGRLAGALAPATVRVAYPGVWLRADVYATHGHYADRETTVPMFERLGAGAMARLVGEPSGGPARAEDYEAVLAPIYAWLYAIAQHSGPRRGTSGASARAWSTLAGSSPRSAAARSRRGRRALRRRSLALAFPAVVAALNRARIGPLHPDISGPDLRRAALRAFAEVLERLGVEAEYVVFGHTHRAGPLASDERAEWRTRSGAQLLNCGCWVHEPRFLEPDPRSSPYRPGFAVSIDGAEPPRLHNVLDGITARSRG